MAGCFAWREMKRDGLAGRRGSKRSVEAAAVGVGGPDEWDKKAPPFKSDFCGNAALRSSLFA